ncbi:MAG TPA: fumarylacetoacetate hydrolase family protein [Vicinamibacterales bacterium]|nr:fumarylacetoacetate hydrolase family protein [Vicinamibacterales bacterium]
MGVKRTFVALVVAGAVAVIASAGLRAQGGAAVAFKLGTFEQGGRTFVGLVLRDAQIVDIARANAAYETANASGPKLTAPADMKQLIARYDSEWRARLMAIARTVPATGAPAYVYAVSAVKILPPVRPSVQLNAGGNYVEHEQGIATNQARAGGAAAPAARGGSAPAGRGAAAPAAVSAPGIWERKPGDTRDNPYLFLKSPSVIVGNNDPIVVPRGRVQIDFECEFATVIGKPAHYVPVDKAADYIFGYTAHHDVSDRQGRGDRKMGGSDWMIGKNHDTFGPLGPYIVPKEFIKDPMNTRHTMYLNGMVMQDSNTRNMSHNIWELLSFASNITTLNPGDVISGGSPAGTNLERADPRWMRAGDMAKCDIEGIGALTNPVVAESSVSTR